VSLNDTSLPRRAVAQPVNDEQVQPRADEQSLKAIVGDLWQHGEKLVKAEAELAVELGRTELNRHVEEGKVALRRTVIMSGFFYAGYLTLLASLVLGLSTVMPAWLAALAVGIVSAIIGYLMLRASLHSAKQAIDPTSSPTHGGPARLKEQRS